MMLRLTCADCRTECENAGRGLCGGCYRKHRLEGTLERFPPLPLSPGHVAAMAATGLTYRRLDYWTRKGYLKAENPKPGPGTNRSWSSEELAVAELMLRLTEAGLTVAVAHQVARGRRELAPGISIAVDSPMPVEVDRG